MTRSVLEDPMMAAGPSGNPSRAGRRFGSTARALIGACLLAVVASDCGIDTRGGGLVIFPADVRMQEWRSLTPGSCVGLIANVGQKEAMGVRVHLAYSTPAGDTVIQVAPSVTTMARDRRATFSAMPQVTNGEMRHPRVVSISWSDGYSYGEPAPSMALNGWCRLSADSMRGSVGDGGGLAYHVVVTIDTDSGAIDIPIPADPVGAYVTDEINCPYGFTCRGFGYFHAPSRDSAGILLPPKATHVGWEDFAGVAGSLDPPYYRGEVFDCPASARPAGRAITR